MEAIIGNLLSNIWIKSSVVIFYGRFPKELWVFDSPIRIDKRESISFTFDFVFFHKILGKISNMCEDKKLIPLHDGFFAMNFLILKTLYYFRCCSRKIKKLKKKPQLNNKKTRKNKEKENSALPC